MKTKDILKDKASYPYYLGKGNINDFKDFFDLGKYKKILILSDDNVYDIYGDLLEKTFSNFNYFIYVIEAGEKSKSMDNIIKILNYMFERNFTKSDLIISFGGGVISDMSGFISSIYQRGIEEIKIPTSLLSAVDRTVGGKNGINTSFGKNQIGTFKDPLGVFLDIDFFKTLEKEIFYEGMAEVIKIAISLDKDFFMEIKNAKGIYEDEFLLEIIERSVNLKAKIVNMDKFDQGIRHILNFGHTIGHGIEAKYEGKYFHGQCVAMGMYMITAYSEYKGYSKMGTKDILKEVLIENNLPYSIDLEDIYKYIYKDKKRNSDKIDLAIIEDIGKSEILSIGFKEFIDDFITWEKQIKGKN